MKTENYFVYILVCENGAYYTGYTTDLARRYQEHIQGSDKCKFTRSFKPIAIAQSWRVDGDKGIAMKVEHFIKKMSKKDKTAIIRFPEKLMEFFPVVCIYDDTAIMK